MNLQLLEGIKEAYNNAIENGNTFDNWSNRDIASDMWMCCGSDIVKNHSVDEIEECVRLIRNPYPENEESVQVRHFDETMSCWEVIMEYFNNEKTRS